jgi:hypothetical protein
MTVSLVELESLPEHFQFTKVFSWGLLCSIYSLLCSVLQIIVCPFVLFLLTVILSVFLRYTASVYSFGIFKR